MSSPDLTLTGTDYAGTATDYGGTAADSVLSESFEEMPLTEALDEAIKVLREKAEIYLPAAKMVVNMAEVAPPQAHQDARRRRRLLSAIETIRQHKAGLNPY